MSEEATMSELVEQHSAQLETIDALADRLLAAAFPDVPRDMRDSTTDAQHVAACIFAATFRIVERQQGQAGRQLFREKVERVCAGERQANTEN